MQHANVLQVMPNSLGVGARPGVAHVQLAAQLYGGAAAALGQRGAVALRAQLGGELPPHAGQTFVDRPAAGVFGNQRGLAAQKAGQGFQLGPARFFAVKVQHAFAVAVQVQKVVGVMGELHQRAAQALQFGRGFPILQVLADGGAHRAHVGIRVLAQGGQHLRRYSRCQIGVMAVEVLGGVQLKAPHGFVV